MCDFEGKPRSLVMRFMDVTTTAAAAAAPSMQASSTSPSSLAVEEALEGCAYICSCPTRTTRTNERTNGCLARDTRARTSLLSFTWSFHWKKRRRRSPPLLLLGIGHDLYVHSTFTSARAAPPPAPPPPPPALCERNRIHSTTTSVRTYIPAWKPRWPRWPSDEFN
jgi:hypothetical protein